MTILTDLAIPNSMSSFVPTYWLNLQILVAMLMNLVDKDGTTKVYIPVHSCNAHAICLTTGKCYLLWATKNQHHVLRNSGGGFRNSGKGGHRRGGSAIVSASKFRKMGVVSIAFCRISSGGLEPLAPIT